MYEWQTLKQYDTMIRKEFERRADRERFLAEVTANAPTGKQSIYATALAWISRRLNRSSRSVKALGKQAEVGAFETKAS
jgi:hypothetical protein